jgi:hypothetical protein
MRSLLFENIAVQKHRYLKTSLFAAPPVLRTAQRRAQRGAHKLGSASARLYFSPMGERT